MSRHNIEAVNFLTEVSHWQVEFEQLGVERKSSKVEQRWAKVSEVQRRWADFRRRYKLSNNCLLFHWVHPCPKCVFRLTYRLLEFYQRIWINVNRLWRDWKHMTTFCRRLRRKEATFLKIQIFILIIRSIETSRRNDLIESVSTPMFCNIAESLNWHSAQMCSTGHFSRKFELSSFSCQLHYRYHNLFEMMLDLFLHR